MKKAILTIFSLALAVLAWGEATIKVNVPNLVAVDEQFNVTFIIEGEGQASNFEWSPGEDFQLVWGPQKGSSTSISIVNGKRSQSSQTTFTYVLMPRATGTFQIAPATAKVKGEQVSSRAASVQVVSNGASSQGGGQAAQQESQQRQQQSTGEVSSEDIFLRLYLSKTKAVVGETLTATLKLFQRVNIAGFEDAKFPTFNGFWSQEVQAPSNIEFRRESVGDIIYNAAVLRSWTIIPQQAGEIMIDPSELVCLVNVRAPRTSTGSIFDSFFQDDYRTIRKRVTTPAIKVQVSKVPAGAPESFGGGVGVFKMTASVSRDSLRTHDAASLKVTVSGQGNLALLEAPKINFPPDFEVYDTKVSDSAGSKTFEYPFIPRSHGEFVLGPVIYSYYNPSTGKYVTLSSDPMTIKVSRGAESDSARTVQGGTLVVPTNRKDVKDLGSDIRFISSAAPSFSRKGSFFAGSPLFWAIFALLVVLSLVFWLAFRSIAARRADVVGTKSRGATKMARRRLSRAGEFLSGNLYSAFYEELHKALLGYVADKLNMPASDLSKDNIASRLQESGVPEGACADFVALLDACEFARYAPSEGREAMQAHYDSAVSVISAMDSSMHKKSVSRSAAVPVLALLLALSPQMYASSAQADSLWTAGAAAYADGDWSGAIDAWNVIVSSGQESPELYYNLGNACFKSQDYGHAILWYERSLKLDPSYNDARFNLEFARTMIQDRIESVPEFFLKTWMRKFRYILPSGAWAVLCLVLLAVTLSLVLLFLLGRGRERKAGFFGALAALLLMILCLDFSLRQRSEALSREDAVVIRAVSSVKSAPGTTGATVDLFVLHEGTKVKILDSVGDWMNIELSDGRQGWMRNSEIEII